MLSVRNWLIGGIAALMLYLVPLECRGVGMPETITINSLAQYYEGVTFNHSQHINLLKDCAECHHHTTGTLFEDRNCVRCHRNSSESKNVACKSCHTSTPFSAAAMKQRDPQMYHRDKPGLKGAYHLSCVGCHEKSGGPTGCEDCHARNKAGDALYNAGEFTPKNTGKKSGHH